MTAPTETAIGTSGEVESGASRGVITELMDGVSSGGGGQKTPINHIQKYVKRTRRLPLWLF